MADNTYYPSYALDKLLRSATALQGKTNKDRTIRKTATLMVLQYRLAALQQVKMVSLQPVTQQHQQRWLPRRGNGAGQAAKGTAANPITV